MGRAWSNPLALCLLASGLNASAQTSPVGSQSRATKSAEGIRDGVYRNVRFGFTYKPTFGWVDRTDDTQAEAEAEQKEAGNQEAGAQASGDAGKLQADKSETLLAMFERPPGAAGDGIDSAVVIVAESLADYHGIKTAADYFGPISELNEQRGFKVENEPYTFPIGARKLVRGDFSKDRDRGKVTMWQSSLVMIEKGYIVSFTFVGGSEDEVESLIRDLSFGTRAPIPQVPGK
jgi:hypothetical protein